MAAFESAQERWAGAMRTTLIVAAGAVLLSGIALLIALLR
jgi:hypothetical protein